MICRTVAAQHELLNSQHLLLSDRSVPRSCVCVSLTKSVIADKLHRLGIFLQYRFNCFKKKSVANYDYYGFKQFEKHEIRNRDIGTLFCRDGVALRGRVKTAVADKMSVCSTGMHSKKINWAKNKCAPFCTRSH